MKLGEFKHPVMVWSMYDETPVKLLDEQSRALGVDMESSAYSEVWSKAYHEQELELAASGLPDGVYRFTIDNSDIQEPGIVVMDGQLEPNSTAHAIYLAKLREYGADRGYIAKGEFGADDMRGWIDHRFIEAVEWRGESFKVTLGS